MEPVPASLARSCPRSFRSASLARSGQDDKRKIGCGNLEPVPASLCEAVRGPSAPVASLPSVRMTDFANLSEVLPLQRALLALVRMTIQLDAATREPVPASLREAVRGPSAPVAVAPFGQDDGFCKAVRGLCAPRLLASVRMTDFGAVDFCWGRTSIYNGRRFRQLRKYVTYVGITGS